MRPGSRSGIGLTILVLIVAVAGILVTASARVFENAARNTQVRVDQTKAHYLAQAAVMRAIWDWYVANKTVEGSRRWAPINTTVTGNNLFKAGLTSAGVYLQSNYAYYAPISHTGIVHVRNVGSNQNKAAGTTITVTVPAAGVQQGDFLVVYFAMDDAAGAVTCADAAGNTYAVAVDQLNATHVRTVILYSLIETALASGNLITVTFPSCTAKSVSVREFTGPTHLDTTNSATGLGLTASSGNAATAQTHELIVGALGVEGPLTDTFTVGTGFTTATEAGLSTGAANTNITMDPEYRIVNATGNYPGDGTICTAAQSAAGRDYSAAVATFYGKAHWFTSGANRRLRAWRIQNVHSASSITLTDIKVDWTGGGAARLNDIKLNNVSVWPGGTATTGTTNNITDTALTTGSSWSGINTYLQWDNGGPADPTTVTCQFIFSGNSATSDATSHEVVMWNGAQAGAGLPGERTFTVVGSGQVNQNVGGNFKVLKTIKAVVSGDPGLSSIEITDWDEEDKNIP